MSDDEKRDGGEFGETEADREMPSAIEHLSGTAERFLNDPEEDAVGDDDASGVEVPQDGDPGR